MTNAAPTNTLRFANHLQLLQLSLPANIPQLQSIVRQHDAVTLGPADVSDAHLGLSGLVRLDLQTTPNTSNMAVMWRDMTGVTLNYTSTHNRGGGGGKKFF
jgi:hypothetical protein